MRTDECGTLNHLPFAIALLTLSHIGINAVAGLVQIMANPIERAKSKHQAKTATIDKKKRK